MAIQPAVPCLCDSGQTSAALERSSLPRYTMQGTGLSCCQRFTETDRCLHTARYHDQAAGSGAAVCNQGGNSKLFSICVHKRWPANDDDAYDAIADASNHLAAADQYSCAGCRASRCDSPSSTERGSRACRCWAWASRRCRSSSIIACSASAACSAASSSASSCSCTQVA